MNKYDESRIRKVIRTLEKAKEEAAVAKLYLTDLDREAIWDVTLAQEHIENAQERLKDALRSTGGTKVASDETVAYGAGCPGGRCEF